MSRHLFNAIGTIRKKMPNIVMYPVLLFILFTSYVNTSFAAANSTFESKISGALTKENLVGISWSTIVDNQIEVGAAGYANIADSQPMQVTTQMHVGSVTKSVLAVGVLRLITQGKLSLNTNVESLLPELNFINPWGDTSPIRVKHLLEHTAGLDNIRMWQFLSTKPSPNMPLKGAFPADDPTLLRVRTEPGTQYVYSNMGYNLLGMVIERVTSVRYEYYLDTELLKPIEMDDSTFEFVSQQGMNASSLLAMGYHENNVQQLAVPMYARAAGQFTTTAQDMIKFIAFLLSDGTLDGEVFIASHLMAMLSLPNKTDAHNAGLNIGHGLALAVRDRHGVVGMCHPGTTFGFRAYICIFPEENKGFFYTINTDSETADYEKFNKLFIEKLAVASAPVVLPSGAEQELENLTGIYFLAPNNRAEFEFVDMIFNFIWVASANDHLTLKSLQSKDKILLPLGDNLFRDITRTQPSHVAYVNDDEELMLSNGLKTYQKGSLITVVFYWLSLALGILGLTYLVLTGLFRTCTWDKEKLYGTGLVLLNILLFILPGYLFTEQSFLEFGDITPASISLAILSGLLPISVLVSLYVCYQKRPLRKVQKFDSASLVLLLQLCIMLLYWNQLPIIFWQ